MKLKTLRILSVLILALFIATRMTASADSHNPYTAQAKIFDKKPSDWVAMVVSLRPTLRKNFNHTLHHVSTTYRPPFQHISTSYCSVLFPYCFRFWKRER